MTTRTTLTLRGDINQCPGCGEIFNSTHAFEMHRVGPHEGNRRRCLTIDEMQARGMVKVGLGRWASRRRSEA